jgi:diaminopimelate epimerase
MTISTATSAGSEMERRNEAVRFTKYHALGNDYLFLDASKFLMPGSGAVRKICHRNFGIGSDGILYGSKLKNGALAVKIINPDGSEAEISGNGLRIFARAMLDLGHVKIGETFFIETVKTSRCSVISEKWIEVDMGIPSFSGGNIPDFSGDSAMLVVNGTEYEYFPVSVGNPHCVVFVDTLVPENVRDLGPIFEANSAYPDGTNVEFVRIIDKENIAVETWERGAGYTLACGSGACATFAVANKLNLCSDCVTVRMPGGGLEVKISQSGSIVQSGPVEKIATCYVDPPDREP